MCLLFETGHACLLRLNDLKPQTLLQSSEEQRTLHPLPPVPLARPGPMGPILTAAAVPSRKSRSIAGESPGTLKKKVQRRKSGSMVSSASSPCASSAAPGKRRPGGIGRRWLCAARARACWTTPLQAAAGALQSGACRRGEMTQLARHHKDGTSTAHAQPPTSVLRRLESAPLPPGTFKAAAGLASSQCPPTSRYPGINLNPNVH